MSNENKNDNDKKSVWAKLLEPETLKQIVAVIGAIAGVITVVGTTVVLVCEKTQLCQRPTPTPSVSPTASQVREVSPSPERTPIPPTATCVPGVDGQLSSAWDRSRLGCRTSEPAIVWAVWQPFERGYMLWRSDTRRVIVFYSDRTWTEFTDQWTEGAAIPSRGSPPPGLLTPTRGFGYIWSTYDDVFNRIGWARVEEKGFCAKIQRFEGGFIFASSTVPSCKEEERTWTTDPSFPTLLFAVYDDHKWQGQ